MLSVRENMIAYRKERLKRLAEKNDFSYVNLTDEQENQLFNIISNIAMDRQNLLLFKNYYKHSFDEIEDITGLENAKGEYLHLLSVLSETLELDNTIISNSSMEKVCKQLAEKINSEINREFHDKLAVDKKENNKFKIATMLSSKVANIAVIVLVTFGILVGLNAYADGKIYEWLVNSFDKYSEFSIAKEDVIDKNTVDITISYIPKGFELTDTILHEEYDSYYYLNDNKFLFIDFVYDDVKINLDTENAMVEEFELEGEKIKTWSKNNEKENFFILSKNGVGCQIYGNITKEDFIKIYDGILIKIK